MRIKANAIVIKPGTRIKLGKYPGRSAATPSRQTLAIKAMVAMYEEIFSEKYDCGDGYEIARASKSNPNIHPSSDIDPN
jgi:hypothetical protein